MNQHNAVGRGPDEWSRDFAEQGFFVEPGVFGPEVRERLLAAFGRVMDAVCAAPSRHETRYTLRDGERVDTWGVSHIFSPGLYDDELGRVFEEVRLMRVVRALAGERLRFWTAHALWSPSLVPYDLNWHRDNGEVDRYFPSGASTHVQFNICLTDDESFRVVPGSHRRPLTERERTEVLAESTAPLPGEVGVHCRAGDVLFMNHHTLHRGSCDVGDGRRTLHINLQPADEPSGGHTSWRFMRDPGYLDRMNPTVRELMANTIAWDDAHPLPMTEAVHRARVSRRIKSHQASRDERSRP